MTTAACGFGISVKFNAVLRFFIIFCAVLRFSDLPYAPLFNSGANHDLVLRTPPLTFRLGMGLSQSETQTKRFATLSVVRIIILIELHFESNLIRLLKHIETMKLKLSQIQMRDPICNTLEKTKI